MGGKREGRTPCQKKRPTQPNTARSTVASAPRRNVHCPCIPRSNGIHSGTHPVVRDRRIRVLEVRNGDDPAPISVLPGICSYARLTGCGLLPSRAVSELCEWTNVAKTDQPWYEVDPHRPITGVVRPKPEECEHAEDENVRDDDKVSCTTRVVRPTQNIIFLQACAHRTPQSSKGPHSRSSSRNSFDPGL